METQNTTAVNPDLFDDEAVERMAQVIQQAVNSQIQPQAMSRQINTGLVVSSVVAVAITAGCFLAINAMFGDS